MYMVLIKWVDEAGSHQPWALQLYNFDQNFFQIQSQEGKSLRAYPQTPYKEHATHVECTTCMLYAFMG